MTLSTAESCTGGRIAAAITAHSGASRYFQGGLVAYQNEVKEQLLGVPSEMIDRYGVVSRQVAEQMVRGACTLFHTDYALASTGYAEPWQGHDVEMWNEVIEKLHDHFGLPVLANEWGYSSGGDVKEKAEGKHHQPVNPVKDPLEKPFEKPCHREASSYSSFRTILL